MTSIGIVIPCYNESKSLLKLIDRLSEIKSSDVKFMILDNGSTDETSQIISKAALPKNILTHRIEHNQGYGFGIVSGLKIIGTDYVGWTHADLQTDPRDVLLFLEDASDGAKFLKGLRYGRPASDKFFTAGMSIIVSILFQRVVRDVNAQPTILSREAFERWQNPPNDFSLEINLAAKHHHIASTLTLSQSLRDLDARNGFVFIFAAIGLRSVRIISCTSGSLGNRKA